ncbi:hypothetical protein ACFVWG_04460 [Kribbella sp. NPDC058245]|uniref:hypothetical protein n=1 Tax=Kribbella sp. NPDC058245 TaxID=3346399 RepID=UPI0036ED411F
MFDDDLTLLATPDLLESAAGQRALSHRADARVLEHALVYADRFHPDSCASRAGRRSFEGRERGVVLGGEGCPEILEFAIGEFAVVLGVSPGVGRGIIGDALALRHRFPLIWAKVLSGEATPWKACRIVRDCLALSEEAAQYVDGRVADLIDTITPYRLDKIVKAAKMHADPDGARAEAAAKVRERGVFVGRSDEHGTKTIYIRTSVGAATRFDAVIDALGDAQQTLGDTRSLQFRRAEAVGILADPVFAQELLAQTRHAATATTPDTQGAPDTTGTPDTPAPTTPAPSSTTSQTPTPASAASSSAASSVPTRSADVPARGAADPQSPTRSAPAPSPATPDAATSATQTPSASRSAASGVLARGASGPQPSTPSAPAPGSTASGVPGRTSTSGGRAAEGLASDGATAVRDGGPELRQRDGGGEDDWDEYSASMVEPGLHDEADRDAPHPSTSNLPDPFDHADHPSRWPVEPFDPASALEPDGDTGEPMDATAQRALASRLAQIKRDAYTRLTPATTPSAHARPSTAARPGKTEIYVHLTDQTLAAGDGVIRVEGHGPSLASQLGELIGYGPYVVKPVIDLNDAISVNCYEATDRIRERVKLTHPVELFPYGTRETSKSIDLDHITPYDPLGPPGQTSTTNLAPLSRYGHRLKTHAHGWKVRRINPTTLEWRTPHGFVFHVRPTGTHRILEPVG